MEIRRGQRLGNETQARATEAWRQMVESKDREYRRKRDCRERGEEIVLRQGQREERQVRDSQGWGRRTEKN